MPERYAVIHSFTSVSRTQFLATVVVPPSMSVCFRLARITRIHFVVMVATCVQELVAWQRMYELSVGVWRATDEGAAARDFKFRDQIRDASDSAHRNIAEGFGRYNPTEFARFLDIARASAEETRVLLEKGRAVGYLSQERFNEFDRIAIRGLVAMARLQRYLRSAEAKRNANRNRYRKRR